MNGKIERVKKRIDEIKKEREELKEKYDYLVEQMKKTVDKHSQDIMFLKNEVKGIADKGVRKEERISNIRSLLNSLEKKTAVIGSKQSLMKEKLREEVDLMGEKLDSEISEKMKIIQNKLVDDLKIEIDKSLEGLQTLEKDVRKIEGRNDKFEDKISNLGSLINSLAKSLSTLENKQSALKESISEDMKSISKDINSRIVERLGAVDANIKIRLQDAMNKNVQDTRSLKDDMQKMVKRGEEYEKMLSEITDDINLINKSISELEGEHGVLKNELDERVNLLERETNSELEKAKRLGERLSKDVDDFEKFASEQKSKMGKFESDVSNKIDMFAMERENIKRDFSSISNDFKNMGGRLVSLSEKDSDINQRLQNMELDVENFKKVTEEVLGKLQEDHIIFKENLVAKVNEVNDKILSRLSQNELGTSSEIDKQANEIKLFRAHVTQFINDLVDNYEKRFDMMKSEIDQALRLLEERSKEQRAMIFE